MVTVEKILLEFNPERCNLLPALKKISAVFGYVSEEDAEILADYLKIPIAKIYETATFYDLINTRKPSRTVIKVCSSVNCALNDSFGIIREIENRFKIKAGDQNNPKVKLETVSCLGRCGEGPIVVVNGKIYTNISVSSVHGILKEWL